MMQAARSGKKAVFVNSPSTGYVYLIHKSTGMLRKLNTSDKSLQLISLTTKQGNKTLE